MHIFDKYIFIPTIYMKRGLPGVYGKKITWYLPWDDNQDINVFCPWDPRSSVSFAFTIEIGHL